MKHRQGCSRLGYIESSPSTATIRSRAPPSIISSSSSASSNAQSAKSRSPRDKPDSPHVMIKVNTMIPNSIPITNLKGFQSLVISSNPIAAILLTGCLSVERKSMRIFSYGRNSKRYLKWEWWKRSVSIYKQPKV